MPIGGKTQSKTVRNVRITDADSPFTASANGLNVQHVYFCDTDGGAITFNLPAGVSRLNYRVINVGSGANDVTVVPNGSELLKGANSNQTVTDGNDLTINYETTEGWW